MAKTDTTTRHRDATNQLSWDKNANHPLQSWAWGEFRNAMGIDVVRTAQGQFTFHRIPHTPWTIGYFPKGPTPSQRAIAELRTIGRSKHAIFIQIEPNVLANSQFPVLNAPLLIPSHRPLFTTYTYCMDLTKTEEELLAAMHPKTRYNIRVAKRHGVVVKEDNSPKAFAAYLRLNQETTARQGFFAHTNLYHTTMWRILHKAHIAHLFTATYKNTILSTWIIFSWKNTIYYPYGASSRDHKNVMAPTIMLWDIARWAKKKGYAVFDLWGCLGPDPNPKDPWIGFHRFKQGFHPKLVEFVGSYDLIIHPALYRIYTIVDHIRWFLLRIKRKF